MTFDDFIRSLRLRHFEPGEFLIGLDRGNSMPPDFIWPNIALTAVILDELRSQYGSPVTITSAYRDPEYNRVVGGGLRSQHQAFTALDFKVRGVSPSVVSSLLKSWRGRLFTLPIQVERVEWDAPIAEIETWDLRDGEASMMRFAGGIGTYATFVHLDTRGRNHTWGG